MRAGESNVRDGWMVSHNLLVLSFCRGVNKLILVIFGRLYLKVNS